MIRSGARHTGPAALILLLPAGARQGRLDALLTSRVLRKTIRAMNRAGASPRVTHLAAVIALIITATAVTPTVLTRHALTQSKTNRAKRPAKGGNAAGGSRAAAGESS